MARRRVVTGLDAQGRSIIVSEGPSPGRFESGEWEEIWAFDRLPASITDPADPVAIDRFRLTPLPGQIAVRLFTIAGDDGADRTAASLEWAQKIDHAETEAPPDESPWMHRTPTIDIIVIVSGEMDLMLDGGHVVHLVSGDSVVQRGRCTPGATQPPNLASPSPSWSARNRCTSGQTERPPQCAAAAGLCQCGWLIRVRL